MAEELPATNLNYLNVEYYLNAHPDKILPALVYTLEEADDHNEIVTNVTNYVKQSLAEFVTGARPLSDWDNYLKELDKMGLPTWMDNAQAAYDRIK